jgi:hypothetical protein
MHVEDYAPPPPPPTLDEPLSALTQSLGASLLLPPHTLPLPDVMKMWEDGEDGEDDFSMGSEPGVR